MTEHYTRNTESATAYCNKCGRLTQHAVSGGRRGRCLEHEASGLSKKEQERAAKREKEQKNPRLF